MQLSVKWKNEPEGNNDAIYWENYVSISFHIEWDMILVTIFLSILNQMDSIWFKIENKTVTTIISHSLWKEMEK